MFYIIIFSLLAVLLVVAGLTVLSRRRTQLGTAESHAQGHGSSSDANRRARKAQRAQSRHDRRKRH
jgi:hypothetical protein